MHKYIARVSVATAACLALSTLGAASAGASREAPRAPMAGKTALGGSSQGRSSPGSQLWVARYNVSGGGSEAHAVAVSPSGGTVFVTGQSWGTTTGYDYATVAYNTATGARLWAARYNANNNPNLADDQDSAYSVAVSPDGGTVFVTGQSFGATTGYDYATIAYNAATGTQLWVARYNGSGIGTDNASSVAVSPTGGTVYVTGLSLGAGQKGYDYATVAYNAATGTQLWVARYNGRGNGAESLAVSPDGGTVYVTGYSLRDGSYDDYATVAYNAATGAQLWAARYHSPGKGNDLAYSVAVSPSGGTVFVTGQSYTTRSGDDYATVAYNASTGAQQWVAHYNGPGNGQDIAYSAAVSPTGGTLYVTGSSAGLTSGDDYATIAYNAATGAQQWVARYNGPGNGEDIASSVAVSPTGRTLYVTGRSDGGPSYLDYATVAYNAATGAQQWVARYNGPGNNADAASSVAVAPTGQAVYVTGYSWGGSAYAYATVAYHG